MTTDAPLPFDRDTLERMNAKAVENQFFTPDHVYLDLALLKDIPLGVVYADVMNQHGAKRFDDVQRSVVEFINTYQKRVYETIDEFLKPLGYSDLDIERLLASGLSHDQVFLVAPSTYFLHTLIMHTVRNQNNSGPANKFIKKKIDKKQFTLTPIPITYYINTYPLRLSTALMNRLAPELGESLGVNIQFLNKDPVLFDKDDWDTWLSKIECFYLNNLGKFTRGDFVNAKQSELGFCGCFVFARKRFETCVKQEMTKQEFEQQIQWITSHTDMLCDFAWLENNDVRLTQEVEHIPFDETGPDDNNEQTP